tara:strand:+ start:231 stop:920 length:690 start_codon:yes stop_codon:yes gene_type:complete
MKRKSVLKDKPYIDHDWWDKPAEDAVLDNIKSQTASISRKSGLEYEENVAISILSHAVRKGYYMGNPNRPSTIDPNQMKYHTYNGAVMATDRTLFSSVPNVPPVFTAEMKLTINENIKGPMLDQVLCFAKNACPVLTFTPDKDNQLKSGKSKYIDIMAGIREEYGTHMVVFIDNRPEVIAEYGVKRKTDEHIYNEHVRPMWEANGYISELMEAHEKKYDGKEHPFYDYK